MLRLVDQTDWIPSWPASNRKVVLYPACAIGNTSQVGILKLPEVFRNILEETGEKVLRSDCGRVISMDRHFFDLTPLNRVVGEVRAE